MLHIYAAAEEGIAGTPAIRIGLCSLSASDGIS
jgi:hypothetical protein